MNARKHAPVAGDPVDDGLKLDRHDLSFLLKYGRVAGWRWIDTRLEGRADSLVRRGLFETHLRLFNLNSRGEAQYKLAYRITDKGLQAMAARNLR